MPAHPLGCPGPTGAPPAPGERTAEEVKISIGSAYAREHEDAQEVRGRDLVTGLPGSVMVTSTEIREAMSEDVAQVVEAVKSTFETTPPELAADIMERGIFLAGGGALLRGLDQLLEVETSMPVHLAEEPENCVVLGASRALEDFEINDDGTFVPVGGDTLIYFVEWSRTGEMRSESVHHYGSATLDTSSPHHDDQVATFLADETTPVYFEETDLRAHLEREYRPGQEDAAPR